MAFLKLVNDVDGTAVRDGTHDLVVRAILLQVSNNFLNLAKLTLDGATRLMVVQLMLLDDSNSWY